MFRRVGVRAVSDIEISPAGVLAAQWDGEGRAEWLAGETADPRGLFDQDRRKVRVGPRRPYYPVAWPLEQREIFIGFRTSGSARTSFTSR